MKRVYGIVQQLTPVTRRPYRVIETNITSDGPRSRICDGTWPTFEEALASLKERQAKEEADAQK